MGCFIQYKPKPPKVDPHCNTNSKKSVLSFTNNKLILVYFKDLIGNVAFRRIDNYTVGKAFTSLLNHRQPPLLNVVAMYIITIINVFFITVYRLYVI